MTNKMQTIRKLLLLTLLFASLATVVQGQVTIGSGDAPQPYSVLELFNDPATHPAGLRLPQMTTVQRDNIKDGAATFQSNTNRATPYLYEGLTIYNTTTRCVEYYDAHKWVSLCLGTASIYFEPALDTDFPPEGDTKGPFTPLDVPNCTGTATPYSVVTVVGGDFCFVNITNASTGAFTVGMSENSTAASRTAIVRVTNNCIGEFKEYIFTQKGNTSLCTPAAANKPTIVMSNGGTLCQNGKVYMSISNYDDAQNYIWTLNGVNKGSGRAHTATEPGNYIVYVGGIGCSGTNVSAPATVTSSATTAPNPVVITATNGAVLCGSSNVTLTATGDAGTIHWYKDGVDTGTTGTTYIVNNAAPGSYFAVLNGGGCDSKESNIIAVSKKSGGAAPALTAGGVTINGIAMNASPAFCDGGLLQFAVSSPEVGVTYTWYVNAAKVGTGTPFAYTLPSGASGSVQVEVYAERMGDADSCPASLQYSSNVVAATPINALITGATSFCNNDPNGALLQTTAGGSAYVWTNTTTNTTANTFAMASHNVNAAGSYKVTITNAAGCVSQSPAHTVVMQGSPLLNWVVQSGSVGQNIATIYTIANTGTTATSYTWTLNPAADVNNTIVANGLSATVKLDRTSTLSVTASNTCGTSVPLTLPVTVISTKPATPIVTDPLSTLRCGGYQFSIDPTSLAAYAANAKFNWTLGGVTVTKQTVSGSRNEFCYVEFSGSGVVTATAKVTVDGLTSDASALVSVSGSVKTNSSYSITGILCYDVAQSNFTAACGLQAQRTAATFDGLKSYSISGTPAPTSVVWSVSNDNDKIITSITASGTGNKDLSVQFDPTLPTRLKGNATGFKVTLVATVTTTDGGCTSVYTLSREITIKDCQCCESVTDYEGNVYTAKLFGTQCWMTQNLRSTKGKGIALSAPKINPGYYSTSNGAVAATPAWMASTAVVATGFKDVTTGTVITQKAFAEKYGALYNHADALKACPDGWRLSTVKDWDDFAIYIAAAGTEPANVGKKLKADDLTYANRTNTTTYAWAGYKPTDANNLGFNAYPAGSVNTNGTTALDFGSAAYWWTSTSGTCRFLVNPNSSLYSTGISASYYFSVRCVKEN